MNSNEQIPGRTIKMFLADGTAGGIITAEVMNWIGKIVVSPRSRLPELFKRDEVARTGVYILTGEDEGSDRLVAYIGESDEIRSRLAQHNSAEAMAFFNRVCLVVSKDENLTKAHVRFLEGRLIKLAQVANRVKLKNLAESDFDLLPESDRADMQYFLQQIELILPALGYDLFKRPIHGEPTHHAETETISNIPESGPARIHSPSLPKVNADKIQEFALSASGGITAAAYESDGEFVIKEGSFARKNSDGSGWDGYKRRRDQLTAEGLLVDTDDPHRFRFATDVPLRSPSEAASIVLAISANGRDVWKVKGTSKTYNAWLAELLQQS